MLSVVILTIASSQTVSLSVDLTKPLHSISPYIYGVNQAEWGTKHKFLSFGRIGGNRITAYNWETNASNAGNDYHHQNDAFMGGGETPGEAMRKPIAEALAAGKSMLVTVPTAGYVSADKKGDGDVNKSSNYLQTRFIKTKAKKGSAFTYPPDLTDGVVYEDEFVWWVEKTFKNRRPSTQLFYALDNEPDIWNGTHERIWPKKPGYADILGISVNFASAIKDVAPKALVFGPASYGWGGMVNFQSAPDANGRDFLDFYLSAMFAEGKKQHRRLLDVLDLHWYSEAYAGKNRVCDNDTSPETNAVRVQSTRGLWDPGYDEPSWIGRTLGEPVRFLPRIQAKIAANYPGTKLAITEYNYGGNNHISGGVAEADALGIFGREGIFAASVWGGGTFVDAALDAYCNFDGKGGHFGETALSARSSDDGKVSIYASRSNSSGGYVMVVVNKQLSTTPVSIHIGGGKSASIYRLTEAEPAMRSAGVVPISGGEIHASLPPMSVSTYVIR